MRPVGVLKPGWPSGRSMPFSYLWYVASQSQYAVPLQLFSLGFCTVSSQVRSYSVPPGASWSVRYQVHHSLSSAHGQCSGLMRFPSSRQICSSDFAS